MSLPLSPVHIERLRTLYSMMAGIPDQALDLRNWRTSPKGILHDVSDGELLEKHTCGTTGCAMGWASLFPEFRAQGLKSRPSGAPEFRGASSWGAIYRFFGLNYDKAKLIFLASLQEENLSAKRHVLKQIRLLLLAEGAINQSRSDELDLQEQRGIIA